MKTRVRLKGRADEVQEGIWEAHEDLRHEQHVLSFLTSSPRVLAMFTPNILSRISLTGLRDGCLSLFQ
jgi:hypothetical protein